MRVLVGLLVVGAALEAVVIAWLATRLRRLDTRTWKLAEALVEQGQVVSRIVEIIDGEVDQTTRNLEMLQRMAHANGDTLAHVGHVIDWVDKDRTSQDSAIAGLYGLLEEHVHDPLPSL